MLSFTSQPTYVTNRTRTDVVGTTIRCADQLRHSHSSPKETRTPISALKGRRPMPVSRWSHDCCFGSRTRYPRAYEARMVNPFHPAAVGYVRLELLLIVPSDACIPLHLIPVSTDKEIRTHNLVLVRDLRSQLRHVGIWYVGIPRCSRG